ncbi:hypothetical protein ABEB36_014200 [Hypothenemus hampei]|uniref:FHA domain-containing protein n=1 Tax=Hypothenemus hampei TaxID=57062 RepID=A0ABD1E3N1_HYPHA
MGSKRNTKRENSSSSSSEQSTDSRKRTSRRSRSRESPKRNRPNDISRSRRSSPRSRRHSHSRDDRRDRSRGYDRENRRRDFRRANNTFNRRRRSRSKSFDHANAKWGKSDQQTDQKKKDQENKAKPNFSLSGKLTEETNTYRGVVIKYSEPPEARKPKRRWRLYPFKGDKALQTLYIHRESGYLIGRDRKVVDIAVDHPSCSKQHAALQYRLVPFTRDDGSAGKRVRPYLIDLDSANGTFINNKKIEPKKYVELLERDVIKFGFSSREYVLLHENSKDEALDDDVKGEDEVKEEKVEVKVEN